MIVLILIRDLLLWVPLFWELNDDKEGEALNRKKRDVFIRVGIALITAAFDYLFLSNNYLRASACFVLSMAIHFFFFDYLMNIIRGVKDWFSHLGKNPFDQLFVKVNPVVRLYIRLDILIAAYDFFILT